MNTLSVIVKKSSHANFDSLPLRFGIHFEADETLELTEVKELGKDPSIPDRFHVEAKFSDPRSLNSPEHFGHFVLAQNPQETLPVLVTVWRGDRDTEWGLSNTMTALRKDGFLSVQHLLEMHPLYLQGRVTDSAGLLQYMSSSIARKDIERFEKVADQARLETARLIKNLDTAREEAEMARNKADRMEKVAHEAISLVEGLELERNQQQTKIDELEKRIKEGEIRYRAEVEEAKRKSDVPTLSAPDTLVEVQERVMVQGSLCTVLVFANGTHRHMKTETFDKDGAVTQKAKELVGSRVKTSCWDPVGSPGKWSSKGYFRNIYETK